MVDGRWAMMNVVRPRITSVSAAPDPELGLDVDAAGGVVEDEDARVHDQRARDGDALALAAAEREAALADDRVVALGERGDEVVRLRGLRGAARTSLVARLRPAEADVLGDRGAEQERVLRDDADVAAQIGESAGRARPGRRRARGRRSTS